MHGLRVPPCQALVLSGAADGAWRGGLLVTAVTGSRVAARAVKGIMGAEPAISVPGQEGGKEVNEMESSGDWLGESGGVHDRPALWASRGRPADHMPASSGVFVTMASTACTVSCSSSQMACGQQWRGAGCHG